jgi:hypothetical protein
VRQPTHETQRSTSSDDLTSFALVVSSRACVSTGHGIQNGELKVRASAEKRPRAAIAPRSAAKM